MSLDLTKGQRVELTKTHPGLKKIKIGLGWDVNPSGGKAFDLDSSVFMLDNNGKLLSSKDVVYFKNLQHESWSVIHSGDNLTGAGEGDDEVVTVEFDKIPSNISKLACVINIYDAENRRQNFGMVNNAFARVSDETGKELLKYELAEDYSIETGVIICEIYRHNGEWKFSALGQGIKGNLNDVSKGFGLNA